MRRPVPASRLRSVAVALLVLCGWLTPAFADRTVPVTIIPEPLASPDSEEPLSGPFNTRGSVVLTFALPEWLAGSDMPLRSAELHLTLAGAPEEQARLSVKGFDTRTLTSGTIGPLTIRADGESAKGLVQAGEVQLELSNADVSWHGPDAEPALRPRLVLNYVAPDAAAFHSAGVGSLVSAEAFWPSRYPERLVPYPVAPGEVRSYAPVFREGQAIVLAGPEDAPALRAVDGISNRPVWISDPVATRGQHLVLSQDGSRLYLLGDDEIRLFGFEDAAPHRPSPIGEAVKIEGLDLAAGVPPVLGPGGNLYFVTKTGEAHGLDPAFRELWSVPLGEFGPLTLGPQGAFVFATTADGLVAIDARTGATLSPEPSPSLRTLLKGEGVIPHAPLAITLTDETGLRVIRVYAAASAPGATDGGAFDIYEMALDPDSASPGGFELAETVEATRGQPVPDASADRDETGLPKTVLSAAVVDGAGAVISFSWDEGAFVAAATRSIPGASVDAGNAEALPPVHFARDGANRVYLLTGQQMRTAEDPRRHGHLRSVELGDLAGLRGEARLMLAGDGRLYARDTISDSRQLWLLVPELDISDGGAICSPTYLRAIGQGPAGTEITAGAGVTFAPGTSLAAGSSVRIDSCG